jgi:hypothetical protein
LSVRRQAGRQLQARDILVVGKARLDDDVAEVGVLGHRHDARRQPGRAVNRQREGQAARRRDVDDALAAERPGLVSFAAGSRAAPTIVIGWW